MEQIVVPQFLEVEDTIIGPITIRQFLEVLVGGLFIVLWYRLFDFSLFAVLGILTILITVTFAFIKINGQPFHYFALNFIGTLKSPKVRVWSKRQPIIEPPIAEDSDMIKRSTTVPVRTVSASRLSELSLIVDTGGVYQGETTPTS